MHPPAKYVIIPAAAVAAWWARGVGMASTAPEGIPASGTGGAGDLERRQRRLLFALVGACFMINLDSRVVTPLLPTIAGDFHTSVGAAGSLVTAYVLPYGLFQLVYGPLADRFGKVRI